MTNRIITPKELFDFAANLPVPFSHPDKYAFVLRLCAHISGCTVEQVDAQIVRVMSEQKWEDV